MIELLRNAKKNCQTIQDVGPNEVKQDLKMAPHWSAQKWINVLARQKWSKEKVSILFVWGYKH